jgi:Ribbon-helix-helix protein, copG family.
MGSRTVERLEEYKDREGISKSQAVERMVKQGLDVEESDMRLVPVKTDGGTMIENKIDSVENSLDSQSEAIQRQQSNQVVLNVTLIGSLVWVFLQLFYGFPQWFTLTSGLGIILLLIGLLYKVRTNV